MLVMGEWPMLNS